jgi:hypothetical protein
MSFFLTTPTDPGTGTPPGGTASWTDGSTVFPFVILEAGISAILAGSPSTTVSVTTPLDDGTLLFATIRGVPDATSFSLTIVNSGADLLVSAAPAAPTLTQPFSWMIVGPLP